MSNMTQCLRRITLLSHVSQVVADVRGFNSLKLVALVLTTFTLGRRKSMR